MVGLITGVTGITAFGASAGIKAGKKKDLAMIASSIPASAAAVYTKNRVKAAPLIVNRENLKKENGKAQAIVINSGIANACTGHKGKMDSYKVAEIAAKKIGIREGLVLVASTGKIGPRIPVEKIAKVLDNAPRLLGNTGKHAKDAAEAIMTTDSHPKQFAARVGNSTIAGIAKGAGMIRPDMATMLSFIVTDAEVSPSMLGRSLKTAVGKTFNMVVVDGDMSTNDMVIAMANGLAGKQDMKKFQEGLEKVCMELAKMVAADGEGATRLIEVEAGEAASNGDAAKAARAVAGSSLVKAAVHGKDPNWGRIMAALGYSGAEFCQDRVEIRIGNVIVVSEGVEAGFAKKDAKKAMAGAVVRIGISLGTGGRGKATAWGCDLTEEYVRFNSKYTT